MHLLVRGLALDEPAEPQPPVDAYFFEFFTMKSTHISPPGTKVLSNSADFTRFQEGLTRTAPSGKGSVFDGTPSWRCRFPGSRGGVLSSRWETATVCNCGTPWDRHAGRRGNDLRGSGGGERGKQESHGG